MRGVFAAAVGLALAACATKGAVVGQSTAPASVGDATIDAAAPLIASKAAADDWRAGTTRVTSAPFVSKGHAGGRWEAVVSANALAVDALDGGAGAYPPGARFVEEHHEKDAGGPVFAMEKQPPGFDSEHGDWRYAAINAAGAVVAEGPVASCRECHGEAPRDHVFPLTP